MKTAFLQSEKFYKAGELSLGERKLGTHAHKKSAISTVSALISRPISHMHCHISMSVRDVHL